MDKILDAVYSFFLVDLHWGIAQVLAGMIVLLIAVVAQISMKESVEEFLPPWKPRDPPTRRVVAGD